MKTRSSLTENAHLNCTKRAVISKENALLSSHTLACHLPPYSLNLGWEQISEKRSTEVKEINNGRVCNGYNKLVGFFHLRGGLHNLKSLHQQTTVSKDQKILLMLSLPFF
jgi:hypothetical protein